MTTNQLRDRTRASRLLALLLVAACADGVTVPDTGSDTSPERPAPTVLGLMEVTLSDITTPEEMSAFARARASVSPAAGRTGSAPVPQSLTAVEEGEASGLQLEPISTGSFTHGERGGGGERYVSATFRVRNASVDSVAYTQPLENATFLAVATSSTLEGTAVSRLVRFDGNDAASSLALDVLPTGAVHRIAGDAIHPSEPDVLQVFTEGEVAAVTTPDDVTSVFPYGFAVRAADGGRALPADPDPGQFDGLATFAFRLPLAASSSDDAFEISVMVLAVTDSETRVTQSVEEQTTEGRANFEVRADALGAGAVNLLPHDGGHFGPASVRWVCRVRTAGSAGSPTAHLVDEGGVASFQSLTPDPFATDGSASSIAGTTSFEAAFVDAVTAVDPRNFTVRGLQSGPAFLDRIHSGNGTATITTDDGSFLPGEEVEVVVTSAAGCDGNDTPYAARFRVAGTATSAQFAQAAGSPVTVGSDPDGVAAADLDGDGLLDLAVANRGAASVSILLGNGDGTFQAASSFTAGGSPFDVAIADVDGGNGPDLIVANFGSDDVTVQLNG
ncbi:MAG: FG-GAP-like repeat-containing protein, partial [Gemmatimonadota bacterium]